LHSARGIGEQAREPRDAERLFGIVGASAVRESAVAYFRGEPFERPFAGRVDLEGLGDECGTFGVRHDVRDLATTDQLADVQVAERSAVRVATPLRPSGPCPF